MKTSENYKDINKTLWNNKVDIHIESEFYDHKNFLKGKNSLNEIELAMLGNLKGKSVLHLQCHFGQDSISLSRLGAKVTAMDISDKAISAAREIAQQCKVDTEFICCDLYSLPKHLDKKFDVVFTSYGVIGWLPNLNEWAQVVASFLKPKGRLVFAEFHPVVWMFDDDFNEIKYNYFNAGAIIEDETGTYAEKEAEIENKYVAWNHSMSEVVNSLIKNGMQIMELNEYNYSPYNCLNGMAETESNKYQIKKLGDKIPLVYAILASAR